MACPALATSSSSQNIPSTAPTALPPLRPSLPLLPPPHFQYRYHVRARVYLRTAHRCLRFLPLCPPPPRQTCFARAPPAHRRPHRPGFASRRNTAPNFLPYTSHPHCSSRPPYLTVGTLRFTQPGLTSRRDPPCKHVFGSHSCCRYSCRRRAQSPYASHIPHRYIRAITSRAVAGADEID
jgi:hypothetical protein